MYTNLKGENVILLNVWGECHLVKYLKGDWCKLSL